MMAKSTVSIEVRLNPEVMETINCLSGNYERMSDLYRKNNDLLLKLAKHRSLFSLSAVDEFGTTPGETT